MADTAQHRLLIVDDDEDIVEGLEAGLRSHFQVDYTTLPQQALSWVRERDPYDAIVSDSKMPEISGDLLLRAALERDPRTARILLTGVSDLKALGDAVNQARVHRFLTKPYPVEAMAAEIDAAIQESAPEKALRISWLRAGISPRECEVLDLLLRGERVRNAAAKLHVSEHTVRNHVKSLLKKFGVRSQADLVLSARQLPNPDENT